MGAEIDEESGYTRHQFCCIFLAVGVIAHLSSAQLKDKGCAKQTGQHTVASPRENLARILSARLKSGEHAQIREFREQTPN